MLLKKYKIVSKIFTRVVTKYDEEMCDKCYHFNTCNTKIYNLCKKANFNSILYSSNFKYCYVIKANFNSKLD